jgi:polar amino acid transport system permease protein
MSMNSHGGPLEGSDVEQVHGHFATEKLRQAAARYPIKEQRKWISWMIFGLGVAWSLYLLQGLLRKKELGLGTARHYFFNSQILHGVLTTLEIGIFSMALAIVLAVILATMRLSDFAPVRVFATAWVWFFRMIPLLVLLIIIYNMAIVYPALSLGVPFGPTLFTVGTRNLLSPFWVAIISFSISESASSAEILRTSILSIPKGQWEAATVLGMRTSLMHRIVILPQAFRIAVPPLFNDFINLLKSSALVAFIGVFDLFYTAESIYELTYQVVPLLIVATGWYLFIILLANIAQIFIERHYNKRLGKLGGAK